jgi:hypothetical protein
MELAGIKYGASTIHRDEVLCLHLGLQDISVFSKVVEDLVACQQSTVVVAVDASGTVHLVGERSTPCSFQRLGYAPKSFGDAKMFSVNKPEHRSWRNSYVRSL